MPPNGEPDEDRGESRYMGWSQGGGGGCPHAPCPESYRQVEDKAPRAGGATGPDCPANVWSHSGLGVQ